MAGHDRLWIARVMVNPESTMRSSPTSRVSPWAMVLVAMSPRVPRARQQGLRAQEEVGHLVGAALGSRRKHVDEPVADVRAHGAGELLAAEEWRVPDDRVEPAAFDDDIRRLDDPMIRLPALVIGWNGGCEAGVDDGVQMR